MASRASYSSWEELLQGLSRSVVTPEAAQHFQTLADRDDALGTFGDAATLLAFLADRDVDPDVRNVVFASLVILAQGEDEIATFAMSLLWLALVPALDSIYRRQLRYWRRTPDALVSEIAARFTSLVRRANMDRLLHVAASLVRSTERDVVKARQRSLKKQSKQCELDEHLIPGTLSVCSDDDVESIRTLLVPVVANDADLVVSVAIVGDTQAEAALHLGISHEAAGKRYRRAVAKLRAYFSSACPIPPAEGACTRQKAA